MAYFLQPKMETTSLVGIVIGILLAVVMIPVMYSVIGDSNYKYCPDDVYDTLNETDDICFDGVNYTDKTTNITPSNTITTTEVVMLSLISLFIVLGLMFLAIKQAGLKQP